jgi:hypothetical protein
MSHNSFLILDDDAWEATLLPNTLGSTVASQQIILIKKRFSLLSSSRIIIPHSKKYSSLSPLSFCSHSSTSKKMQTREREKSLWKKEKK